MSELGDPQLALNLNLAYGLRDLELSYSLRYSGKQTIGSFEEQHRFNGNLPTDADRFPRRYFPVEFVHGVRGEYTVSEELNVFAGVDNLTDSLPPLGQLGFFAGEPYDSIGRYFYVGMTADL